MSEGNGFTVKEIVLQTQKEVEDLAGEVKTFITLHEARHLIEQEKAAQARADPKATPAGQKILDDLQGVADSGRRTRDLVQHHDVLIQRLIGAMTLGMFLVGGGLGIVILQNLGIIR